MSAANYVPHTTRAGTREGRSPSSSLLAPPKGCVAYIIYRHQGLKTLCTRKTFINF